VLRSNLHCVDVNVTLEPSLLIRNLDVIAAHLPLLHEAVLIKSPVLEAVAAPPLVIIIMELIPELDSNLGRQLEHDT
jgi:hypothetical protein